MTDEEKLQIAQHYLLSSPPGQFQEVLSGNTLISYSMTLRLTSFFVDVRKLVSSELLTDALVSGIARVSNLKNSKVVISPLGNKVIMTSQLICFTLITIL